MRKTPAIAVAIAVVGGLATALPAAATDGPATIPQSQPAWATPQAKVANVASSAPVTFRVYLKTRNEAGAEALANQVSNPNSSSYRHFLSTSQIRAQFAPTTDSVNSVRGWLGQQGFSVGSVPANNAYVEASGSAAQIDGAFHVQLGEYSVKGQKLRAANTNLSVPSGLSDVVLGVVGIDQSESLMRPDHVGGPTDVGTSTATNRANANPGVVAPPAGFRNAQPCGDYYGQKIDTTDPAFQGQQLPYAPCGYKPQQVRAASGVDQAVNYGVDGSGQTVAIVDAFASPTLYQDAAEYARRNDPGHPLLKSQFSEDVFAPTPGQEDACGAAGWYGEQTLDVEAVHAMAPAAHILYVGGADCQDLSLDKALNEVVSKDSANIVSNSYGDSGEDLPASDVQAFHQIAVQAVLEGIGLYFSSGDNGDEAANDGQPEPDFSASDPYVTAVGGTSTGIGRNGNVVFQTGWETGKSRLVNGAWTAPVYQYGAGGGTSRLFSEPWYQKGIVPTALAQENHTGGATGRVVPDVSMLGDPNTGFLVGETQTFPDGVYYDQYRIGGTSLASPLMAGLMADADQFAGFNHGFINPVLYQLDARTPAIHDVKAGNGGVVRVDYVDGTDAAQGYTRSVRMFNDPDQTIHTATGYDNVTGVGTPYGWLFLALA